MMTKPGTMALSALLLSVPLLRLTAQAHEASEAKLGATVEITRSHSWCWFPTIHRFRSGEIIVGMVLSPDQINSESATSGYCISKDRGQTWSRRFTMGEGANQDGAWSEAPDKDDMIWQFGSYPEPVVEGNAQKFYATMTKFGRGGRFSSEDRDVTITLHEPAHIDAAWLFDYRFDGKVLVADTRFGTQFHGRPWGNIVQDKNGYYYCTAYFNTEADGQRELAAGKASKEPRYAPRFNRCVVLRSTDNGKNWVERGVLASIPATGDRPDWVGFEGYNEGSLAVLPDGRLFGICRTGGRVASGGSQGGTINHAWSSDGGKTWTAPASIGFGGVAPRVHRLASGALAVVTGRPGPVTLHINPDGRGEQWLKPITIYSEMSSRYCDFIEVSPGKLLVVYDHLPYGWMEIPFADREARNIIYGTFVDLAE